jgi:hypothetical protein
MREQTAELIYGVTGQKLSLVPPEWPEGQPSSLSVKVYPGTIGDDDTYDWTVTPTVDTVSTTVNTASGYSQTYRNRAYLASTAGIVVGHEYRIANGAGQAELVRVKDVATTYVVLDRDLVYDYEVTTSTFKGIEVTAAVNDTWVAASSNLLDPSAQSYRAVWDYTVNSLKRRHVTFLRLVRQPWQAVASVQDLRDFDPDLPLHMEGGDEGCARLLSAAHQTVRADILAAGYQPESIRDTEVMRLLVVEQARLIAARRGKVPAGWDVGAFYEAQGRVYQSLMERMVRGALNVPVAQNSTGATTAAPAPAFSWER